MIDPDGHATANVYDNGGNLLTTNFADGTRETYTYDPLGDALSYVNRNGQTTGYTYNSSGQLTEEMFADGSQYDYTYDSHNNLLTATDATGTTTFTYDTADRMTSVSYPNSTSLTFTYDAGGRRISMVDQSGYTVNYVYTPAGELQELTDGNNNAITTYTYDADGRLSRQTNANGTYSTYQYDVAGNVTHLINFAADNSVSSRFDYSYDLRGNVISMATLDGTWTYSYDAASQLIRAIFTSTNPTVPNQDLAYNYDPAGNRTSTIINGVTTNYVANAMNEYTSIGGTAQQYDADGNLIFDGTNTYTYNQLDELTSVTNSQGTTQYTYNALDQRVAQSAGGQTTQYLIDPMGLGNVVSTYDGVGTLLTHFNYGLALVSQTTAASQNYFYEFDNTGSTVGLSDASGHDVDTYRYLPFGQSLTTSGTVANPFQFVGGLGVQTDSDGLDFMRARYFDSGTGRFLSSDPLELLGGDANFYRYAGNQPLQFVDPTGFRKGGAPLPPGAFDFDAYNNKDEETRQWEAAQQVDWTQWITQYNSVSTLQLELKTAENTLNGPEGKYYPEIAQSEFQWQRQRIKREALNLSTETYRPASEKLQLLSLVASFDPNDKIGPGFGASGFVAGNSPLPYRIDFENDPSATAPAQEVVITDQLSSNDDWSSFRITQIGWGDTVVTVPANEQHFQTTVAMTFNGVTFDVLAQVGINLATGLITAQFFSIDPATDLPPDVLIGFLPPEDGTGRGMGYITYTVQPKSGLPTGTQIRNVANVSFDEQQIVATDQVDDEDPTKGTDPAKQALVTIDSVAPSSSVLALSANESSSTFTVSWSGQDDTGGSGISSYTIFVSDDGGAFTPWLTTANTSATYAGAVDHTYAFYSVATDNVGNVEAAPTTADTQTSVHTGVDILSATFAASPSTQITVHFANPATVSASDAHITLLNGSPIVASSVNYNSSTNTAVYNFSSAFSNGIYLVQVNLAGQTDSLGNPSAFAFDFLLVQNSSTYTLPGSGQTYTIAQLLMGSNSKLNISNNTLLVSYTPGNSLAATVGALIASGYSNGNWTGPGIFSSIAAADTHFATGVGYFDNGSTVKIADTWNGDTNLDGQINSDDLSLMMLGQAQHGTRWQDGNFNYDSQVDADDWMKLAYALAYYSESSPFTITTLAVQSSERSAPVAAVANHPWVLSFAQSSISVGNDLNELLQSPQDVL
jgi:RHS repeat-associated protein